MNESYFYRKFTGIRTIEDCFKFRSWFKLLLKQMEAAILGYQNKGRREEEREGGGRERERENEWRAKSGDSERVKRVVRKEPLFIIATKIKLLLGLRLGSASGAVWPRIDTQMS